MLLYKYFLILFMLKAYNIFAEETVTVYACSFSNKKIGYYDRPCEYINNNFNVTKEDVLKLIITKHAVFSKRIEKQKHDKLANKCQLAKIKVPWLIKLLADSNNDIYFTKKIKRALYRSRKHIQNYCHSQE